MAHSRRRYMRIANAEGFKVLMRIFLYSSEVSNNDGNVKAHFTTSLRNPSMSSSWGRTTPDFSEYEFLVVEVLEEEFERKIEFSIKMGDEVFVQPRFETSSSITIDGAPKTTITTTTTTTQNFNAAQNLSGFFTPSSAALLGTYKIVITCTKQNSKNVSLTFISTLLTKIWTSASRIK